MIRLALVLFLGCGASRPSLADGPGTLVCEVDAPDLTESSGLVRGSVPGTFWTHNDSGGKPEITAFDTSGTALGVVKIEGATAVDWEEIAAWDQDGKRFLLIADSGDNNRVRSDTTLYLLAEPDPSAGSAKPLKTLRFRFPDGAHDCEAIAVDPATQTILLVTKDRGDGTRVFTLPLGPTQAQVLTAEPIATLELAPAGDQSGRRVTAMDLATDGSRVAVLTYTVAWEWERTQGQSWAETFSRPRRSIALPALQQREGLTYGADNRTIYVNSEGSPMPLIEISPP